MHVVGAQRLESERWRTSSGYRASTGSCCGFAVFLEVNPRSSQPPGSKLQFGETRRVKQFGPAERPYVDLSKAELISPN